MLQADTHHIEAIAGARFPVGGEHDLAAGLRRAHAFRLREGVFPYVDCGRARLIGSRKLESVLTLRAGEVFTVSDDPPEGATAVYADPDDYGRLHREFVPLSDRLSFLTYRGFYLCVKLSDIVEGCEPL